MIQIAKSFINTLIEDIHNEDYYCVDYELTIHPYGNMFHHIKIINNKKGKFGRYISESYILLGDVIE